MTSTTQIQTSVLDAFQVELLTALQPYMDEVEFAAGECLYAEGDLSDAFFIVKEGDVRLQIHSLEVDTDPVLDYVGAGSFIGHDSVLAGLQRWVSAYAETDVLASKVSSAGMRRMLDEDPEQGIAMLRALGRDTALKFRSVSQRLGEHLVSDFPDPEVERMVGRRSGRPEELRGLAGGARGRVAQGHGRSRGHASGGAGSRDRGGDARSAWSRTRS